MAAKIIFVDWVQNPPAPFNTSTLSLTELELDFSSEELPQSVISFFDDCEKRIDEFLIGKRFAEKGFVACDHWAVAKALQLIDRNGLAMGHTLCEWGSGFGEVAMAAEMLGYEACGLEINSEVFDHANQLAEDYGLETEFVCGSFLPDGADDLVDEAYMENDGDLTLEMHFEEGYSELDRDVSDFDIIFVFPWPNDAPLLARIFDRYASSGALLLTYNDASGLKIERKD